MMQTNEILNMEYKIICYGIKILLQSRPLLIH
jgi:hypothetical protein